MKLYVSNKKIKPNDHFQWHNFNQKDFINRDNCVLCNGKQDIFTAVENTKGEVGLVNKFCNECGILSKSRLLSPKISLQHFAKNWLVNRHELISSDFSVFNVVKPYLDIGDNVLDIGCGIGSILLPFKSNGYQVFGIEPSEHRSEIAKMHLDNIKTGPIESYIDQIPEKKFKLIIFNDVFQFLASPFEILKKLTNKLADNGFFFIKMGALTQKAPVWQVAHNSVVLHSFSIYSLSKWSLINNYGIKVFSGTPIIAIVSKNLESNNYTVGINKEINEKKLINFAKKTLPLLRLGIFGNYSVSFAGRSVNLRLPKDKKEKLLPIRFIHECEKIPLMIK